MPRRQDGGAEQNDIGVPSGLGASALAVPDAKQYGNLYAATFYVPLACGWICDGGAR